VNETSPVIETPAAGETPPAVFVPPIATSRRVFLFGMRNALPFGFIGLIALFVALGAPNFLTFGNVSDIVRLSAPIMIVAVPMAFLLIMGYVDLSIGSTQALAAVVTGLLITIVGAPPVVALLGGVVAGAGVGAVNGIFITRLGLSPIIVTLGMLTAVRGIALLLAPSSIYAFFDDSFAAVSYTGVFGIPYYGIAAAVVVVAGAFILAWSPIGRHALAIGVNEEAAFLSGINSRRVILSAFVVTGAMAGVAGVMYALLLNSAPSGSLGILFELDVLTAVMLGGVAFNGGRGTIRGVVLGVLFLAVLQNGLILLNVPTSFGMVIKGAALIFAASLDRATLRAVLAVKGR
jgi:ribose/xylose/arabinose/galactoside ABC-type transport system permease subunit